MMTPVAVPYEPRADAVSSLVDVEYHHFVLRYLAARVVLPTRRARCPRSSLRSSCPGRQRTGGSARPTVLPVAAVPGVG
jgi:hypothetical protein